VTRGTAACAFTLLVLGAALPAAGGAGTRPAHPPLLGIVDHSTYGGNGWLVRFDPRTLRALPGRRVALGAFTDGWSFSPARRKLVLGFDNPSCVGGSTALRFVDTAAMRRLGDVPLLPNGNVDGTYWLDATHVLAVVQATDCLKGKGMFVYGVDAATRTVDWRTPIPGDVAAVARGRGGLVLLLAPRGLIGPARLTVLSSRGALRIAALGLRAGVRPPLAGRWISKVGVPGLAVSGNDAFVVPAAGPMAEVDLRTMKVRRLGLRQARSLEKGATGTQRTALALGNGLLAVTGWNFGAVSGADSAVPAGLELIDSHTRRYRVLDSDTSRVVLTGGVLLADGGAVSPSGLTAYSTTGRVRYREFAGRPVTFVGAVGGRGYAEVGAPADEEVVAFDLRTGRSLRPAGAAVWSLLLQPAASYWAGGY
jgi:hypothetical protein